MTSPPASPRLVIDTRPLWRVLFSRTSHWLAMLLALAVFASILAAPLQGITPPAQRTLAIFALCAMCWATQAIPLSATGLLVLALLPICGVMSPEETFSLFGSRAVFFILGAFIIAAAVMQSGLSSRFAMIILSRFGRTPTGLMLSITVLAAALSHLMPEHAVAAMLLPIVIEISRALRLRPGASRMGSGMFLGLAWGAIIGGIATFLGGARNVLAVEILQRTTGQSIGFLEFWRASFPVVLLMLGALIGILLTMFRPEIVSTGPAQEVLRARLRQMGRMSLEERMTGVVLAVTVIGWVVSEHVHLDIAVVALAGAVSLFALRVISWQDVERHVNWGIILMYGGAIALGQAMDSEHTGAAEWLARSVLSDSLFAHSILTVITLAAMALLLTEGLSNAAVVAMIMPIALDVALRLDVDPALMVYAVALPAGLAFTLPIASPPNALVHSTGHVRMRHFLTAGPLINVISLVAVTLVAIFHWGSILGLFEATP
ncbi:MAG: DASS family sodium-coupled anion symporter [Candidatus Sumerlaeia bacterium]|nr:DASS family sodium-coupled anion symporter [Candidatus Sumerlaeia bacterium]